MNLKIIAITLFLLILIASTVNSIISFTSNYTEQLINGSFENWTGSSVNNWVDGGGSDDYMQQNTSNVIDGNISLEYVLGSTSGSGNDGIYQNNRLLENNYIYCFNIYAFNPNSSKLYMRYQFHSPTLSTSFYITSDTVYQGILTYQPVAVNKWEHTKIYFLNRWGTANDYYVFIRTNQINGRFIVDDAKLLNTGFFVFGSPSFIDGRVMGFTNSDNNNYLGKLFEVNKDDYYYISGVVKGVGVIHLGIIKDSKMNLLSAIKLNNFWDSFRIELGYLKAGQDTLAIFGGSPSDSIFIDDLSLHEGRLSYHGNYIKY